MTTFTTERSNGKRDYVSAVGFSQALASAKALYPEETCKVYESSPEEVQRLIRSHSLPTLGD